MTLLTINAFPYKHGLHAFNELIRDNSALLCSCVLMKSAGGSDVFLYPTVIRLFFFFFFFPARKQDKDGNYLF